jgi:DNA-binding XRE family transcriptional regulator
MDTFRVWLGERIIDHDLTVTALSHFLDIFDGTIEDWLAGRSVPTWSECLQLAEFFEEPQSDVLRAAGHAVPPESPG